ncbi:MAG: PspC domain-containing protein [Enterobacteriaceae bacterium]
MTGRRQRGDGRKLYRIPSQGMVSGVCAGIARYCDLPVLLVRVITLLLMFGGLFVLILLLYIVMVWSLPTDTEEEANSLSTRQRLVKVKEELTTTEQRLRVVERYITSDTWRVRRQFREL